MREYSEVFVGMDVAKLRNAVALAESGRDGDVRYLGEIDNTPEATRRLVKKLEKRYSQIHFCYEAGPTGYGLYRQIEHMGHDCMVIAPSLIPVKPGERRKTNRIDATKLARLLRSGELTRVWVPDAAHEAIRDLVRTRSAASRDLRAKRQHVTSFLLRHGLPFPGKTSWGRAHATWLSALSFEHVAQTVAFHDMVEAVRRAESRISNLEKMIAEFVPTWSLAPVATALQALRGFDFVSSVTLLAEVGDLTRFDKPRQLMAYLGLVPSESSTGDSVNRGPITKTGNREARRTLVECSWAYQYAPKIGEKKLERVRAAPDKVQAIAWKAQMRLTQRYRQLMRRGKLNTVVIVAIARELSGFVWAIAKEVTLPAPPAQSV